MFTITMLASFALVFPFAFDGIIAFAREIAS